MLEQGAVADAAQTFSAILAEEQDNLAAVSGLARAHLALGAVDKAKAILGMVPPEKANDPALAAARAQIELAEASAGAGEAEGLMAAITSDPDNHQARFDLAMAHIAKQHHEAAIEQLLELFRRDREWNDGAAREQLFKLFDSLGPKSDLAQKSRRRLSSMIFA